jgi:hypothetical protein
MKYRALAGLGIMLIVCAISTALLVAHLRAQSPEAKFDRITKGMSRAEVEAILGRPADQYNTTDWCGFGERPPRSSESSDWPKVTVGWWQLGDRGIEVWFDQEGTMYDKRSHELYGFAEEPTFFQQVAKRLGL